MMPRKGCPMQQKASRTTLFTDDRCILLHGALHRNYINSKVGVLHLDLQGVSNGGSLVVGWGETSQVTPTLACLSLSLDQIWSLHSS